MSLSYLFMKDTLAKKDYEGTRGHRTLKKVSSPHKLDQKHEPEGIL